MNKKQIKKKQKQCTKMIAKRWFSHFQLPQSGTLLDVPYKQNIERNKKNT